jgi:hypothetical protein
LELRAKIKKKLTLPSEQSVMMGHSRFANAGEENVVGAAKFVVLFVRGFKSEKDVKDCILQAISSFDPRMANDIEQAARDHISYDEAAKDFITKYGLSDREAEAIVWWSVDVGILSALSTLDSPYAVLNSILRKRDASLLRLWSDYNFYLINGLKKILPIEIVTFRGESKRVTELSKQYVKGNKVDHVMQNFTLIFGSWH